jgi:asparagine synthase (glutamine-hydrolysing)
MCGIWAFINFENKNPNYDQMFVDFMKMKARGPDMTSFQTLKNLSIGFHRLAIMNPTFHANQPYILENGEKTIIFVCNGEIYNFKELINDNNLPIYNNSDCMTIPQLYLKYVNYNNNHTNINDFVKLFSHNVKGEYAFMIFEFDKLQNLKDIIVARDHVGIRPLYYGYKNNKNIMFSSEIKGMHSYNGTVIEFEPGTIKHFQFDDLGRITYEKNHNFKKIYNIIPYNDVSFNDMTYNNFENLLLTNVREALIASVKRRLTADVPIGFLVSGGLDSSIIAGIASKLLNKPLNTFCCGILGTNSTDIKYAKTVANHIKSNHTEVLFSIKEALESIPTVIKLIESYDVTTIRASVGQYMVSKHIGEKTDIKVILTGELSDEVTSGYIYNYYAPDADSLHHAAIEYVKNVHIYDGRRVDRCISGVSCEARIAFSDPEFIASYWSIPTRYRLPSYKNCEKWWLRKAFENTGILNNEVLWRRKEAFSDGISGTEKSWFEIIQDHINLLISDDEFISNKWGCVTKEQYYYRKLFCEMYGEKRQDIIPHMWIPKWDSQGNEITEYVDPSARTLGVYKKEEQQLNKKE